jgi:hypothetical protein
VGTGAFARPASEASCRTDGKTLIPFSTANPGARYHQHRNTFSMPSLSEAEVMDFLKAVENGSVSLRPEYNPQDVYAGNVPYAASNGWHITIFNDVNEWDYIDEIQTSDGGFGWSSAFQRCVKDFVFSPGFRACGKSHKCVRHRGRAALQRRVKRIESAWASAPVVAPCAHNRFFRKLVSRRGTFADFFRSPLGPYSDARNSIFSSTESCAGVPDVTSPERVATTRNPPAPISTV